jgi:phosphoenolpyruvate-protein kinase (PTS system EI component)
VKLTGSAAAPGLVVGPTYRARATGARAREERIPESEIDDELVLFEGTVNRLIESLHKTAISCGQGAVSIMVRAQSIPGIKKLVGEL